MKRTQYPNLTISHFSFLKENAYSVFLETKKGEKLIARCKTIEQAQEAAKEWADKLHIPIYQRETQAA